MSCHQQSLCTILDPLVITHWVMVLPGLLATSGTSVTPVEVLLLSSGGGEQDTVDYRDNKGNCKHWEELICTLGQLKCLQRFFIMLFYIHE